MEQKVSHNVFLRVSSNPQFGAGHLSRMSSLREKISGSVVWFVDPEHNKALSHYIPPKDKIVFEHSIHSVAKILSFALKNRNSRIICDSYNIDPLELAPAFAQTIYFTDGPINEFPKEIKIVNCQPGSINNAENGLVGTLYMPVTTKGKPQQKINFGSISQPIKCLVSFGALDKKNLTSLVLKSILLNKNLKKLLHPVCLIGHHFKNVPEVERLLYEFENSTVIADCASVIELPLECPIAVGAPGVSHAERLFRGMATVLVAQNDAQNSLCLNWQAEGCAIVAQPTLGSIAQKLQQLIDKDFGRAKCISEKGQKVIDGKGAERIVKKFIGMKFFDGK